MSDQEDVAPAVVGADGRITGTVARWNKDRGYGFIKPDDGDEDVFCHYSSISDGGFLEVNDKIEFNKTFDDRKGKFKAENVTGGKGAKGEAGPSRSGGFGGDRGGGAGACYDWQSFKCTRGSSCRFSHDGEGGPAEGGGDDGGYGGGQSYGSSFGGNRRSGGRGQCYDFQKGECTRGDGCRFSHGEDSGAGNGGGDGGYNSRSYGSNSRSSGGRGQCYDFQKGECTRGDGCRFSHGEDSGAGGGGDGGYNSRSYGSNSRSSGGRGQCYDFQKGECTRGDGCRFSHGEDSGAGGGGGGGGYNSRSSGSKGLCYDFQDGNCTRGEGCRFSHSAGGEEAPTY